jgi:hypothetical protein
MRLVQALRVDLIFMLVPIVNVLDEHIRGGVQ